MLFDSNGPVAIHKLKGVMPRTRRRIESKKPYEICFRARRGLPLVAYRVIKLIIQHAIARAQRDEKVILCHDIWNGSHAHIIIVTKDAYQCTKFYGEIQKKITDCLKRLLGRSHLNIWEGRAAVIRLGDLEHAKNRIAYLYANPAQDDLETSIRRFPGYSSFERFQLVKSRSVLEKTSELVPKLSLPSIPTLQSPRLSLTQDKNVVKLLERRNPDLQLLVRQPNYWMKCFGIEERDAGEINKDIEEKLEKKEEAAERRREKSGKKVMGRVKLLSQAIMAEHTPKKRDRKIFYLGLCKENRIAYLREFKSFCDQCRACYREWLVGNFSVSWPPGAFKPPLPPNMNILEIGYH